MKADPIELPALTRRALLRVAGIGAATAPFAALLGCSGSALDVDGGLDDAATAGADAGGADAGADDAAVPDGWATGGTASMTESASYPDPFATGLGTVCAVTCGATIGPCHTTSPERSDVSDGWDGLPVRLALRLVDEACEPVEGVLVEIWHTNYRGIYSGRISGMCNSAEEDRAAGYFRGYQRTDADGRVDFDTVFPGWYSSRAVHIHFRVQTGDYEAADGAAAEVISQLFFTDALVGSIFASEPLYQDFGQPDTLLPTDNVIGGESDPSPYVCDVARMADGAMLASKTIVLRTTSSACTIAGAMGGGPRP